MIKKGLVILNPNANKGKSRKLKSFIEKEFVKANIDVDIIISNSIDDCREIAYNAVGKYDFITAAGGDGTANEVADGLIRGSEKLNLEVKDRPLFSIFPIGRGNDFAWALSIRKMSIPDLITKIKNKEYRTIDVGYCIGGKFKEGAHFVNGLGIGFEPSVNFIASEYKRVTGTLSYVLAVIYMLRNFPEPMSLKVEKESGNINLETQQLSIGNGQRMGSAFLMTPKAILDDGYFDFVYANRPIPKKGLLRKALKFLSGKQLEDDYFSFTREKWINVYSEKKDMPIHIDGEMVGKTVEKIEITIKEASIRVIC